MGRVYDVHGQGTEEAVFNRAGVQKVTAGCLCSLQADGRFAGQRMVVNTEQHNLC